MLVASIKKNTLKKIITLVIIGDIVDPLHSFVVFVKMLSHVGNLWDLHKTANRLPVTQSAALVIHVNNIVKPVKPVEPGHTREQELRSRGVCAPRYFSFLKKIYFN